MIQKNLWIIIILAIIITGCNTGTEIQISEGWARPGLKDGNSAVYFNIENLSGQDDAILLAESEVAAAVEIHLSLMVDDVMKMEKQDHVTLPKGTTTEFKPGGYHIMLIGLENDLNVGDDFLITLHMEKSGSFDLKVNVEE